MRVILAGYGGRTGVSEAVARFKPEIEQIAHIVAEDFTGTKDFSGISADYAIVFGGDGSILRAARQLGTNQIPVLAVNLGTLGFLADFSPNEFVPLLKKHSLDELAVQELLMLRCEIWKIGEDTLTPSFDQVFLNEICVQGTGFNILRIELLIDGEPITTYNCDGLILSTPVGSTAHNLSAGGPILRKNLDAVVLSPISAHTLSHRPVVDSANRIYELRVAGPPMHLSPPGIADSVSESSLQTAKIVLDGVPIAEVSSGDRTVIRRAPFPFRMLEPPGRTYFETLRDKLGWSGHFKSRGIQQEPF